MVIASYSLLGFATFKGKEMPRKADALDSAKITSNGSSVEMKDVVAIPARRGRPSGKKGNSQQEASVADAEKAASEKQAAPVVVAPPPPVPVAPAKKCDSYVVVSDARAWINGQLIHFHAGKIVNEILFGPKFLARLTEQNVQLKKVEE